jgi:ketosteroid isomerase-like protein
VGEASIRTRHYYSKYLTVWKRQPDGAWKFVADGGNERPGP